MPRLSDEKRRALVLQYVDGVPNKLIAERFGVSPSYPSHLATRYRLKRRPPCYAHKADADAHPALAERLMEEIAKPESPETVNVPLSEIRRLAALGRKRTEIAALLRCPYRVVDAALA
jgi:transposase